MPFGENLRWLLAYRKVTPKEIADYCEVKQNTISNYTNGVSTPNYEILGKIIKFLDVSADDILYADLPNTGLGKKIAPKIAPIAAPNQQNLTIIKDMPKVITVDSSNTELISLVPHKAAAGYLNGYGDPEFIERLTTLSLPGLTGGTHRAFEIRGQSMLPTHHSGSLAIGRFVESFSDIRDRRVYIVVTKADGIVLKRVLNRIKEDGRLILMSDNDNKKEYPNYPVDPEEVLEMWYWRGSFIRESPEPGNVYKHINDIEARLTMMHTHMLQLEAQNKQITSGK
jgi:transcriptional regulator with XRE-family HTH domain